MTNYVQKTCKSNMNLNCFKARNSEPQTSHSILIVCLLSCRIQVYSSRRRMDFYNRLRKAEGRSIQITYDAYKNKIQ